MCIALDIKLRDRRLSFIKIEINARVYGCKPPSNAVAVNNELQTILERRAAKIFGSCAFAVERQQRGCVVCYYYSVMNLMYYNNINIFKSHLKQLTYTLHVGAKNITYALRWYQCARTLHIVRNVLFIRHCWQWLHCKLLFDLRYESTNNEILQPNNAIRLLHRLGIHLHT